MGEGASLLVNLVICPFPLCQCHCDRLLRKKKSVSTLPVYVCACAGFGGRCSALLEKRNIRVSFNTVLPLKCVDH